MDEMRNLSKKLNYYFKFENGPKNFVSFKGPIAFYEKIKDGYKTLEKAEEKPKKIKSDINEIIRRRYNSEDQKSRIKNIETL